MVHLTRSRVAISSSIVAIFTIVRVVYDQTAISALQRQEDVTSRLSTAGGPHERGFSVDAEQAAEIPSSGHQHQPSLVLILGYMRGGTSFVGDLFNQHEGAFYWYEPLDGVYSHLFGTPYGWTPLDITHTLDGEPRRLSNTEEQAVYNTLKAIYTCQFSQLPTEVLTHRFIDGTLSYAHSEYVGCLYYMDSNGLAGSKSSDDCKSFLQSVCPQSFEDPRTYTCHEFLHKGLPLTGDNDNWQNPRNYGDSNVNLTTDESHVFSASQIDRFYDHNKCLESVRKSAESCLAALTRKCQQSTAIVVKSIRMRMSTVELLLRKFPMRLRVLQVFRDPVPVVLSRYRNKLMSAASGGMVITEAVVTCSKMADDIRQRQLLAEKFSKRNFLAVHLEDFARDPLGTLDLVFKHSLGRSRPADSSLWVSELYRRGGAEQFLPCANLTTGDNERDEFAMEYCYEGFLQNLRKACIEYYQAQNATIR